jgi:alkylated DNA repair dioxygenase AlkB
MSLLFQEQPLFPPGFSYFANFLSEEEEVQLLEAVMNVELHTLLFQGFEAKRKVESFGYDYNFDKRSITKGREIPAQFNFLVEKVASFLHLPKDDLAEVLVTEYPLGSVINWHRDALPFDVIAGISLLSDCKFRLRPHDKAKQERKAVITLPVSRRSLYVLRGEARSEWEHSITPVKEKRYSITLRTLKK